MSAPELVEFVAKALVDHPDDVHVEVQEEDGGTLIELHVAEDDMGKVIGRNGSVAKALRTLIKVVVDARRRAHLAGDRLAGRGARCCYAATGRWPRTRRSRAARRGSRRGPQRRSGAVRRRAVVLFVEGGQSALTVDLVAVRRARNPGALPRGVRPRDGRHASRSLPRGRCRRRTSCPTMPSIGMRSRARA